MILSDLHYPFRIKRRNREIIPEFSFQWQHFALQQLSHMWMWVEQQMKSPFQGRPPSDWWCPGQSLCADRLSCWKKVCPSDRPSATERQNRTLSSCSHTNTRNPLNFIYIRQSRITVGFGTWQKPRSRVPFNKREPGVRPWKSILRVTHNLHICFLCKTKINTYPPALKFTGNKLLPQSEQEKN